MKRKADNEDTQRWLLPYSDLMNLLLILFIVLYSMSKTDVQKAAAVAEAIRKGFNASVSVSEQSVSSQKTTGTGSKAGATNSSTAGQDWSNLYNELSSTISQSGLQQKVSMSEDTKGLVITLKDNTLYTPGSAVMSANGQALVSHIGDSLKKVSYALIIVEGHTDSDPIHNSQFSDNIDLSSARADNVERALIARGLDSKKIAAMGRADTVPVAPNDTASDKAMNRRVVISIYKSTSNLTADEVIGTDQLLSSEAEAQSTQ